MKKSDFPAMPIEINTLGQYPLSVELGLTKREHFAGLAMQGILSSSKGGIDTHKTVQHISKLSLAFADALLESIGE